MSGSRRIPLPAAVADYNSDASEEITTPERRQTPNAAVKRSSHPHLKDTIITTTVVPDNASVDSGYSSKTTATRGSADSTKSDRKKYPTAKIAEVEPEKPSRARAASAAAPESRRQQSTQPKSSSTKQKKPPKLATTDQDEPCRDPNCSDCAPQKRNASHGPLDAAWNLNYPPFNAAPPPQPYYHHPHPHMAQPAPYQHHATYAMAQHVPQRPSTTAPRVRPASFHEANHPVSGYWVAVRDIPPPSPTQAPYPQQYPGEGYPVSGSTPPMRNSMYMPPPYNPQQAATAAAHHPPPSPHGMARPALTQYPYAGQRTSQHGPVVTYDPHRPPQHAGPMTAPSPTSPYPYERQQYDDRDLMPPPPPPPSAPRPTYSETTVCRPRPAQRRESSSHRSDRRRFSYQPEYDYEQDSEPDFFEDDIDDYHEAPVRSRRRSSIRPGIMPSGPHHSTSAIPRASLERRQSHRRNSSYVGFEERDDLDRMRMSEAEAYQARRSGRTGAAGAAGRSRQPLTEDVLEHKASRFSIDSEHRPSQAASHSQSRSRAGSDRPSVSQAGDLKMRINAKEGFNISFTGAMDGKSLSMLPGEDGSHELVIADSHGRETSYDGSVRSGQSFASRQGRSQRGSDSGRTRDRISSRATRGGDDGW